VPPKGVEAISAVDIPDLNFRNGSVSTSQQACAISTERPAHFFGLNWKLKYSVRADINHCRIPKD
jgi:hypothetical protein